jgi:hypothetical protein
MEKLEKRVDGLVDSYMGWEIRDLSEQVEQLKAENRKILERQRKLEAQLKLILRKPSVHQLVTAPRARLFSGANFTGAYEDYAFETASFIGGCHELKKLGNNVTSVETFEKCVRLFEDSWCEQRSVAVYPGSEIGHNVLNPYADKYNGHGAKSFSAIGPCLPEEFEDFDFKDWTKQSFVKNSSNPRRYFPDTVQFYHFEKQTKAITVPRSSFSLTHYLLGRGNRLEFLRAEIHPKHLNISQPEFEMQNTTDFISLEKAPGDIVGYGILPSLGGPLDKIYNAFPQTTAGKIQWTKLTSEIRPFLEGGGKFVRIALNFAYEDVSKTRPIGFYFWIGYHRVPNPVWKVSYGRVEN